LSEQEFVINNRRHLPHKQLTDCTLFITWRIAFTLPDNILRELAEKRNQHFKDIKTISPEEENIYRNEFALRHFAHFDNWIDKFEGCKYNLCIEPLTSIITDTLKYNDNRKYTISCYCIMPNHVHLIIKPLYKNDKEYYALDEIMHAIKNYSAHKINKAVENKGHFWQNESYDRIIRDYIEYLKTVEYVVSNPVKAGLVDKWEDWKGTYICKDLR